MEVIKDCKVVLLIPLFLFFLPIQRKYKLKTLILLNMKRAFHFILLIVFLSACGGQSKSTSVGCDTSKKGKKNKTKQEVFKKGVLPLSTNPK